MSFKHCLHFYVFYDFCENIAKKWRYFLGMSTKYGATFKIKHISVTIMVNFRYRQEGLPERES